MGHIAYFNNAATTYPKPEEVYEYADKYYREMGMSSGRGQNTSVAKLTDDTRMLLLEVLHCSEKKVVFTSTATEAINIILQGLEIEDNFNIYISPFEHNAVVRVLNYLKKLYKINIIELAVNQDTLIYDIEKIKYQFSEKKPNILTISHASNVCGVIAPIEEICTLSNKYGSINLVDMCQTAGLIDTDLSSSIYDFIVFAGHKTLYAPFGISGFICNGNIKLKPLMYGGTGTDSANIDLPEEIPNRFEVGSRNVYALAGLYASLSWIKKTGIKNIYIQEQENRNKLLNILTEYNNIKIIASTTSENSVGVISCIFDGYSSDNIGQVLYENGIEVRTGLHCSPLAHKFLDTFPSGTVRFSVGYFNNETDFNKLKEVLDYIEENS